RPKASRPRQALPVEREAPSARRLCERLGREVFTQQRRDVDGRGARERADELVRPPRIADRLDLHRPAVALVAKREGVRRLAGPERDRQAERGKARKKLATVGSAALGDDAAGTREQAQRAAAVVGAAADARPPAVNA